MEADFETLTVHVRDYIHPQCACRVEDTLPHVVEATFDPVNNILQVKVHKGMTTEQEMIKGLERWKIRCGQSMPEHGMEHKENEDMKMKKTEAHNHHAMMESEFKRHFILNLTKLFRPDDSII